MSTMSIIWIAVFALATLLFFGAAVVITVVGTRDLKDLLKKTDSKNSQDA
jgi:hypothetical protein